MQLNTAVSHCKGVETFLEAILFKPFQLFRCILSDVNSITKGHKYLGYISFKIVPLCNYKPLSATVKVLKHSWKPFCLKLFSSFVAFLVMSITKNATHASQKGRLLSANFIRAKR